MNANAPSPERSWTAGRLRVRQYASRDEMGKAAASEAAEAIRQKLNTQEAVRIVFAAAPSQNEFLDALVREEGIDWGRITAFHMDEYIGLSPDAPQRFSHFLTTRLFSRVRPGRVHLLNGAAEAAQECADMRRCSGKRRSISSASASAKTGILPLTTRRWLILTIPSL
ncbi:6-phosphogluconolactonase [Paenibacillus sp. JTLBN-2024]